MKIGEREKAGDEEENVFFVTARKLNCEKDGSFEGPAEGKWEARNQPFSLGCGRSSDFSGGSIFKKINRVWNFRKERFWKICVGQPRCRAVEPLFSV
jgi:hypothetical protein